MVQRILTVVGARPQFIKAGAVSLALARQDGIEEIMLHTGQHFDTNMSDIFFRQLSIPEPTHTLNINSGPHGQMTGRMLEEIEAVLVAECPDRVLVYGDTNSTLAGALAAAKLHIPVAHVEAGLRSFDRRMPEEINRVLTDQLSSILFCPTEVAVQNLWHEGYADKKDVRVCKVGDVMEDAARLFADQMRRPDSLRADVKDFVLATLHRAENTDDPNRLRQIVAGLNALHREIPVVLPLHPRTRKALARDGLALDVHVIDPVGFFEMLWLLEHCGLVATDSGGVQKEAFFHSKHCITMRDTTEWTELISAGVNVLVGADPEVIFSEGCSRFERNAQNDGSLYGGGTASHAIAHELAER